MEGETPASRFRQNAAGIASTVVTGVWLAAMFLGQDWWLAALLFGYIVVVPVVAMLFGEDDGEDDGDGLDGDWWTGWWRDDQGSTDESPTGEASETPLETLRRRYAAGELTDEQFERKLERLLETETLEAAEDRAARESLREVEN